MAKLGWYYGLCPLIEAKTLLGITQDAEKDTVIVTLDQNIAGKYKISNQKQVFSWRTREKFSSPVIYDKKSQKYVAAFNKTHIRLFTETDEVIHRLKRYKFDKEIYTLFTCNDTIFVLFQDGTLYTLEEALDSRKTLEFADTVPKTDSIVNVLQITFNNEPYIGIVITGEDGSYLLWTKYASKRNSYNKINIERDASLSLKGQAFHVIDSAVHLLTIWDDSKMYSHPLKDAEDATPELFTTIDGIKTTQAVSMISLDENYIAMLGANRNEEGATLLLYNTQFKVVQSQQPFKLFCHNAKLWKYDNNLFLPVGQNLAVVPFHLETEQLAALVGSHKSAQRNEHSSEDEDVAIVDDFETVSWDDSKLRKLKIPEELSQTISHAFNRGLPESLIIEKLIDVIIEKKDLTTLSLCLNCFSDFPDHCLFKSLKFLLRVDKEAFPERVDVTSPSFPEALQPAARAQLIDKALSKTSSPVGETGFSLYEVTLLLNYVCYVWSDDTLTLSGLNVVKSYRCLVGWCYHVIGVHSPGFMLTKDDNIKAPLEKVREVVGEFLKLHDDLNFLAGVLRSMKTNKVSTNKRQKDSQVYSVEQWSLY